VVSLLILIIFSAIFSGTESAFTSLTPTQIESIRAHFGKRGEIVARLAYRPDRLLTTVLIGNNLMNIGASALATKMTIEWFGNTAVGIMTGILTLVMLVFAEVTPKQIAIANNEFFAVHMARPIWWLSRILTPLIVFIGALSNAIARLTGGKRVRSLSVKGILHAIRQAENLGILEPYKTRLVKNVFRFSELPVEAIMTHRTEIFSLEKMTSVAEALTMVADRGYARIPVYSQDPERIVGIVLLKDLVRNRNHHDKPLRDVMLDPVFVPEYRRVDRVMHQLLKEQLNMAIVLDEFGGFSGVVTLEDMVEEIIGEIYDENETRGKGKIIPIDADSYTIQADITLSALNEFLPVPLSTDDDVHTLGGYITNLLGRIPEPTECVKTDAGTFTVTELDGNRITQLVYHMRERVEP